MRSVRLDDVIRGGTFNTARGDHLPDGYLRFHACPTVGLTDQVLIGTFTSLAAAAITAVILRWRAIGAARLRRRAIRKSSAVDWESLATYPNRVPAKRTVGVLKTAAEMCWPNGTVVVEVADDGLCRLTVGSRRIEVRSMVGGMLLQFGPNSIPLAAFETENAKFLQTADALVQFLGPVKDFTMKARLPIELFAYRVSRFGLPQVKSFRVRLEAGSGAKIELDDEGHLLVQAPSQESFGSALKGALGTRHL